jgi:hypothetical protein
MNVRTLITRSLLGLAGLFTAVWACSESTGAGQACRVTGSTSADVRIQIANFANISGVRVVIETPRGSCVIDALPVQDAQGNLELGQALFPLQVGDVVSFFLTGGALITKQCRTTASALQFGNADASLQSATSFTCDGIAFVDP